MELWLHKSTPQKTQMGFSNILNVKLADHKYVKKDTTST